MTTIAEKPAFRLNGWLMVLINLVLLGMGIFLLAKDELFDLVPFFGKFDRILGAVFIFIFLVFANGFTIIQPNEARVLMVFGKYTGVVRQSGFFWVNPFSVKKNVSLRIRNFHSGKLKVNDADGNPIEIGAVIVWKVVDSAKAILNVDRFEGFIDIQSETAIRTLASKFPYDAHHENEVSLRSHPVEVTDELKKELQERLNLAGLEVLDARISHLAYAPEIAQAMLRRQQAKAIVAARQQLVEGAVGMVEIALEKIQKQGIELDEERKAAMVNNLMVALVSESQVQPVINAGTLYT
jgi:regulator of protease activity HflC (stomatin/prohibitin superfamily)